MARFQEKEKVFSKHPKLEKALFWSLIAVFAAIAVALIVIIVLMIIGPKDDENEEVTYDETYETAELITFEKLAEILDNDSTSMPADTVYVYIYSPDYTRGEDDEIINEDELDNVRGKINECVTAYDGEEGGECEFYIINVLAKENANYLANNASFLTSNGIPTTNPVIITISNTNNGIAVVESYDANDEVGEFVNYLHEKVLGKVAYTHE